VSLHLHIFVVFTDNIIDGDGKQYYLDAWVYSLSLSKPVSTTIIYARTLAYKQAALNAIEYLMKVCHLVVEYLDMT